MHRRRAFQHGTIHTHRLLQVFIRELMPQGKFVFYYSTKLNKYQSCPVPPVQLQPQLDNWRRSSIISKCAPSRLWRRRRRRAQFTQYRAILSGIVFLLFTYETSLSNDVVSSGILKTSTYISPEHNMFNACRDMLINSL